MYDKYGSPGGQQEYDESPAGGAAEIGGQALDFIKANWKPIVAGIACIVVLFLVYDFFIGSMKAVAFEVTDTEGKPIDGAVVRVLDAGGNEIKRISSGDSLTLRMGAYKMDIQADGYKALRGKSFTVAESGPVAQKLDIDKDLELSGSFPAAFATGEEKELALTITNNGGEPTTAELVLEGDAKSAMSLQYDKPLNAGPGQNEIKVKITVKETPEKSAIGENKSGTIRIAGLSSSKATVQGKYSLAQFSAKSVKLTIGGAADRLDYGNVKPGDHVEKPVKLRNDAETALENVGLSVKVTQAGAGRVEDVQKWFKFTPEASMSVAKKSEDSIVLTLDVPATTKFGAGKDSFTVDGVIAASTSVFSKNVDFKLVVLKPKATVAISGLAEIVTVTKTDAGYPETTKFLDIKNSGETLLTNFDVRVQCTSLGSSWLTIDSGKTEYSFDSLEKGKVKSIPYVISVPDSAPDAQIVNCRVGVFYDSPVGGRQDIEAQAIIKAKAPAG